MKVSALKYTVLTAVATLIMLIVAFMPLHAFLTVWGASLFGHYTALRLWKELLLLVCALAALYLTIVDNKIRTHTLTRRLVQLILLFLLVQVIWTSVAYSHHAVSAKAAAYGLLINCRFLAFFLIAWVVALRTSRLQTHWRKVVLWPATVVIVFGLLQIFILPNAFLAHFGYNAATTIAPFETINHNSHYVRIESTLRGANPLGAYLLIPLSALTVLLVRTKRNWRKLLLLAGGLITLLFSFSRSAWIGAILSIGSALLLCVRSKKLQRSLVYGLAGLVVVLVAFAITLRHNTSFENLVFHTQQHSAIKTTSDQGHVSALQAGLKDVVREPLGRGPGSAGPASVYNNHPARIAENFYVQVGQETGWLGLLLFLVINAGVGYLLWLRRHDSLALSLLVSLIGLSFINLLSHAWADDTLAYVWWGLAGVAMARLPEAAGASQIVDGK